MSDNPYSEPPQMGVPPTGFGGPSPEQIKAKVLPPSIGLLVVGIINVLLSLWGVASSAMFLAGVGPAVAAQEQQQEQMDQLREQGLDWLVQMIESMNTLQGPVGLVISLVQLAAAGVIIFGGLRMMNLRSYGLSLAAAILAIIPLLSNCYCVGIPLGVWAVIVLMDPNVKQSFR
jgi:hypothetical protein